MSEPVVLLLEVLVGSTFGLIASARMKAHGHSRLAGFCLGFFLGVIGLVIAWRIAKPSAPQVRDLAPGWMSRGTDPAA